MKFGLDANIINPPFSAIFSILLVLGCDFLGWHVGRAIHFFEKRETTWLRMQSPIIGVMFLSIVLYPLALIGYTSRILLQNVAVFILLLGVIQFFFIFNKFIKLAYIKKQFFQFKFLGLNVLMGILLLGYALLALSPITNADSLDYHIGVAVEILNYGKMPAYPEWFHSRLAGNGEVLIAFGLAIGAEQFGSLLQFTGLVGVFGILSFYCPPFLKRNSSLFKDIVILAFLSCPVLVFLVSSPKPQLLPVAMNFFALALTIHSINLKSKQEILVTFSIICLLVMTASQSKFSFYLSSGLIGIVAITILISRKYLIYAVAISVISYIGVMLPSIIWKMNNFNARFFDVLIRPFPGDYLGIKNFEKGLRDFTDTSLQFPLSLFYPESIAALTTILGAGLFLFFLIKVEKDLKFFIILIISICATLLGILLGQKTSRFFLEPFIWILFWIIIYNSKNAFVFKPFSILISLGIFIQSLFIIIAISYGVYQLFPGALTTKFRNEVMNKYANGYNLMKWVDSVLPPNAVLLSSHRSIGLAPRRVMSLDWSRYVDTKNQNSKVYFQRIKDIGVTHYLLIGDRSEDSVFNNCNFTFLSSKDSYVANRIPFNERIKFSASLYKINSSQIFDCTTNFNIK